MPIANRATSDWLGGREYSKQPNLRKKYYLYFPTSQNRWGRLTQNTHSKIPGNGFLRAGICHGYREMRPIIIAGGFIVCLMKTSLCLHLVRCYCAILI